MADSPISDHPSAASDDDAVDNNLQPFFVLHKASSRPASKKPPASSKTRRKIDLLSSPAKPDASTSNIMENEASYQRLRMEAFHSTWSQIDAAIKSVLRQIDLNLFDELLHWVHNSFSSIKSTATVAASEIMRPYPIITDTICNQIPTAFVLTKNAEFVDDLLTFQELGAHLRSNGCLVANLSPLDFSAKYGVGSCLRGLSRQLIKDAPDMADIAVLALWYCEVENYGNPIVVIVDDMERCDAAVLAEFIMMLSEWVSKIPIIFIMGVATTIDAPRRLLASDALQHLQACKFMLGSPYDRMNGIVEAVLVKPCSAFRIGQKVALFLRSYFLKHDGTITAFIRALKLACTKHFTEEPLSFLGQGILDEDYEAFWCGKCEALPDDLRRYAFELPSYQREKFCKGTDVSMAHGLSKLRRLQKDWSSVVMCLYEVGKFHKMQLLDIYCETLDPALYTRHDPDSSSFVHSSTDNNQIEGTFGYVKGGVVAQTIQKVRELPLTSLSRLLSAWSFHTEEMTEICGKVRELQSFIGSIDEDKHMTEMCKDINKRSVSSSAVKGTIVNDKAAMLLDDMVRNFLVPIECMPFHEILCYKQVENLQLALIGDPRRTIQIDLLKSHTHLQCSCCGGGENILSPSMHDTSIMYIIAQEYGDLINLHDWYQSFKSTVLSCSTKTKRKIQHSPASKKVKATPLESEATIQARFCRAVTELQITGLLRMPSKRRPDFVQRVAFGV